MERLKEIKEKGVESATPEDIPIGLGVITEFVNTDADAQNLIKIFDFKAKFAIDGVGDYAFSIANGKAEHAQKSIEDADFSLYTSLGSISEVLIGQTDITLSFLAGNVGVEGDFGKMIDFFEVIELAYEKIEVLKNSERLTLMDSKTIRKLYNLYVNEMEDGIDPNDLPLLFDIFSAFSKVNKEAKEILEEEEFTVQMNIPNVGSFVIIAKDDQISWSDVKIDDADLEFELALETAAELLMSGDAASAFLAGKIDASGNIAHALVVNDLIETFLDMLPFVEKD